MNQKQINWLEKNFSRIVKVQLAKGVVVWELSTPDGWTRCGSSLMDVVERGMVIDECSTKVMDVSVAP